MGCSYDPYYAPIQMTAGHWVYGAAAFNRRVKLAGGPSGLIGYAVQATLDHINAMALQPQGNVVQFPGKRKAKAA